ncbi:MAG: DUF4880 domain-containing protein [Rhizobacter sp.]
MDPEVLDQAAEWYAVLNTETVDDHQRDRWRRWVDADPRHRSAWQRVEAINARFEAPPHLDKRAAGQALRLTRGRRGVLKKITLLGVGAMVGGLVLREQPWERWSADYSTFVGEQREVTLGDGTRLWLNTDSAVSFDRSGEVPQLSLNFGEVLVAPPRDRLKTGGGAFDAVVAEGRIRAGGARFSLLRDDDGACCVAVHEGQPVELALKAGGDVVQVQAGQQRRFSAHGVEDAEAVVVGSDAWTRGLLIAADRPLGGFVDELSRHHRGVMSCAPEVAQLRLTGVFPLADQRAIYAALEKTLPIRVVERTPWWVRVESA